ncbi:MAG: hypothetical protein WC455_16405 [Dehalococcoidia bacterium]|jgi:hypothetical protein
MDHITPDPSFLRTLRSVDRKLGVKFNGFNFVVTYERPTGEPANIHTVKRADGSFRQPDQRDIDFIRSFDMENESCRERLARLSSKSEKIRDDLRRRAKDDIRHATLDNKIQLQKAFLQTTNLGKGNSALRRIPA